MREGQDFAPARPVLTRGRRVAYGALVLSGCLVVAAILLTTVGAQDDAVVSEAGLGFGESFRFDMTVVAEEDGAADSQVRLPPERIHITGELADAIHWALRVERGTESSTEPTVLEQRRVDADLFTRSQVVVPGSEDLAVPDWASLPYVPREFGEHLDQLRFLEEASGPPRGEGGGPVPVAPTRLSPSTAVELLPLAYLLPVDQDPNQLQRLVAGATDLVVVDDRPDGTRRMLGHLPAFDEMAESSQFELAPVDLALTLDEKDRPLAAAFQVSRAGITVRVEVRFSDWGDPIQVDPPTAAEVDRTPWIQEELLAAHPQLLIAPAEPPEGYGLTFATVGSPSAECVSVELEYSDEDQHRSVFGAPIVTDEEFAYLHLSVTTTACREALIGAGGASGGNRSVEVGDVSIAILTSLPVDAVDALVASLRPVTAAELAASVPDWVPPLYEVRVPDP